MKNWIPCADCANWAINANNLEVGECRADLPHVAIVPTQNGPQPISYWPPTTRDAGCAKGVPEKVN